MCEQRKGMETTEREGLEIMNWTEEQTDCRAGRLERSMPGDARVRMRLAEKRKLRQKQNVQEKLRLEQQCMEETEHLQLSSQNQERALYHW